MNTLKRKSIKGLLWSFAERLGLEVILLVISIVLARLLDPAEFGLIAMLAIFTAVAQSIIDSGFGSALIQKKEVDQVDTSSVFFLNILVGFILAGVLYLAAPLIAQFFRQPILVPVTRVVVLVLVINPFSLVQTALLTKAMDFKSLMKVNLFSTIGSGLIGILMACMGFGVWALVAQQVSASLLRAVLLWIFNDWHPSLVFSRQSLLGLFSFGSKLMLSGLLDTAYRHIYQAVIGRVFSATELGYFQQAATFEKGAAQSISAPLSKVLFPSMVALSDDNGAHHKAYKKTIRLTMLLQLPIMIGLIVVAEPFILLFLTEKWAPSIPMFQIMCAIGIFYPLHVINLNILKVKGRSDLFLRLEVIKKLITIITIAILYRWGIMILLYGSLLKTVVMFGINSYYSDQLIGYSTWAQIKDIIPAVIAAGLLGVFAYGAGHYIEGLALRMMVQVLTGLAAYGLMSFILCKPDWEEYLKILNELKTQYRKGR